MNRRRLIRAAASSLLIGALPARAQRAPGRIPRVVMLMGDSEFSSPFVESFRGGLRELGHVEGATIALDVRHGARGSPGTGPERIRSAVAENPDVLVVGGAAAARQARDATSTIPVVVATGSDLVDAGVVASIARPGGNVTGVQDNTDETTQKRLELLTEALPRASRIAMFVDPAHPSTTKVESLVAKAAGALRLTVEIRRLGDVAAMDAAIAAFGADKPDALFVGGAPLFATNAARLIERATAQGVPVIHFWPGTAEAGALLTHSVDVIGNYKRAASYVDRILKGAKTGDLAIEQPSRYVLTVNLKTARALGLTIPEPFLARADEVIE